MSLKKVENNKDRQLKISYYSYKLFLKRNNIYLSGVGYKKNNLELRTTLIFSLIYITLKTNQKIWKLDEKTMKKVYQIFFIDRLEDIKKYLIDILEGATKKFNFGFKLDHLDVNELYENLISFYSNCEILSFFKKKEKLKNLNITEEWNQKFVKLNKNLKYILGFIKTSSPNTFNTIYRKLMVLV